MSRQHRVRSTEAALDTLAVSCEVRGALDVTPKSLGSHSHLASNFIPKPPFVNIHPCVFFRINRSLLFANYLEAISSH
ncbi:MAG TPA: hypothetical protein VGJ02_06790 [Pyrinomonadaceae bacterium]